MAFNSSTQKKIANILNLDREQYSPNSRLRALMDEVETFDSTEGTAIVTEVESILLQISQLNNCVESTLQGEGTGLKRYDIDGWGEKEYFEGASSGVGKARLRDGLVSRLRTLIDPKGTLYGQSPGGLILW